MDSIAQIVQSGPSPLFTLPSHLRCVKLHPVKTLRCWHHVMQDPTGSCPKHALLNLQTPLPAVQGSPI